MLGLLLTQQIPLVEIYDTLVAESMAEIGRLWVDNRIGIEQEHLASNTLLHALTRLQSSVPMKQSCSKVALCACLEGEYHELGITCVNNIIEAEGWTTYYLGVNIPADSIVNAIEMYNPDLVCISSTVVRNRNRFVKDCQAIAYSARQAKAEVLFGGRTLLDARFRRQMALHSPPGNASELLHFLRTHFA
jgi:MerR family transcriptional regulator, light-induced transcriptional regulator